MKNDASIVSWVLIGLVATVLWPADSPGQRESVEEMLQRRTMALRAQIASLDTQIADLSRRVPTIEQEIKRLTEQAKEIKVPVPEEEIDEPPKREPRKVGFRPPFQREVEKKTPIVLICQNNRVGILDFDAYDKNLDALLDDESRLQLLRQTKSATVDAGDYQIRLDLIANFVSQTVVAIPGNDGDNESAALRNNSRLMQRVAELNPSSDLIQIAVYPDSFDVFRAIRQELWKREFGIQWIPMPHGEELGIGSGPITQQ